MTTRASEFGVALGMFEIGMNVDSISIPSAGRNGSLLASGGLGAKIISQLGRDRGASGLFGIVTAMILLPTPSFTA